MDFKNKETPDFPSCSSDLKSNQVTGNVNDAEDDDDSCDAEDIDDDEWYEKFIIIY